MKTLSLIGSSALALAIGTGVSHAQTAAPAATLSPLEQAIANTTPVFNVRLRYETVDFSSLGEDAEALTYRIRAGFETGVLYDTKFGIDFEYIEDVVGEYNSTINGRGIYPVVADPVGTELNQLYFTNFSLPDTATTIGRQRIIHDDARFVGNVGWRQNEQTFDALRFVNTSFGGLNADVSYVDQVNRIFGEESPAGRWESESLLADFDYDLDLGRDDLDVDLETFVYLLDFGDDAPAASSETYGLGASFAKAPFALTGRYAYQSDYGDNPTSYGASFYDVSAAFANNGFAAGINYQVLGSDDGIFAFQTPLATLHKFNGFADAFLVTPPAGLQDLNGTIGYSVKNAGPAKLLKLALTYHDFSADEGDFDYGSEFDAVLVAGFGRTKALLKYADYEADDDTIGIAAPFANDIQKLWVQLEWGF